MRHARRQAMAQDAATKANKDTGRGRALIGGLAAFAFVGAVGFGGYQALMHPDTPLPPHWNPTRPLSVGQPVTFLTGWKLDRATASAESCLAALDGFAATRPLADLEDSAQCHIRNRVDMRGVGQTSMAPLETRCAVALRMTMWVQHGLQPAAQDILGTSLQSIHHFGSYSCRPMRTSAGQSSRMSTHATADAIDISGFGFADGRRINLSDHWNDAGQQATFLRAARDSACDWFKVTLSPEYNALHADHFHLQSSGWGLCR